MALFLIFSGCDDVSSGGSSAEDIEKDKADATITWPTGLKASLGQTLADIPLTAYTNKIPGTFSWTKPDTPVGGIGTQSHGMTFTPADPVDYKTAEKNVNVAVSAGMEMKWVTGGIFVMGTPSGEASEATSSQLTHRVTLRVGYYMSKYQVTQEQYEAVMGVNPSQFTSDADPGENQARRPVDRVSWFAAIVFCNKLSILEGLTPVYALNDDTDPAKWGELPLTNGNPAPGEGTNHPASYFNQWISRDATANGYQLPTEAQWEFACRAGTTTAFNTGDSWVTGNAATTIINTNIGWYAFNSGGSADDRKTHEVGLKPANAWGFYDMHGNVYEWCWDWYANFTSTAATNPLGPAYVLNTTTTRVVRGGHCGSEPEYLRSGSRGNTSPQTVSSQNGFRVARSL